MQQIAKIWADFETKLMRRYIFKPKIVKTAKNRQFIGPLGKFIHRNEKPYTNDLSLLILRIMSTFEQISIYGVGGDRF